MKPSHRIVNVIVTLLAIPVIGTIGFMAIEGWDALDSFYMAVITLSTVGFKEIHPLTGNGRVFVIIYILVGLGVFVYGASQLGEMIVRGQLLELLGSRRMNTALRTMKGHIVVCGFGRMGQKLCRRLAGSGRPFLVIDHDREVLSSAETEGWPFIAGSERGAPGGHLGRLRQGDPSRVGGDQPDARGEEPARGPVVSGRVRGDLQGPRRCQREAGHLGRRIQAAALLVPGH